jgi:hypothetical protein
LIEFSFSCLAGVFQRDLCLRVRLIREFYKTLGGLQSEVIHLFMGVMFLRFVPLVKFSDEGIKKFMIGIISKFKDLTRKSSGIKLDEEEIQALIFDIFGMKNEILKSDPEFIKAVEGSE